MGIVPLEFMDGASEASLGLTGHETFDLVGLASGIEKGFAEGKTLSMSATDGEGNIKRFHVRVRIDTPQEAQYYLNGGILQYVLRSLL
jgi:aconitate hydratase